MVYINKEKFKSIVLIILILMSLIQVGILWGYQSYRFPFGLLTSFFRRSNINDTTDIEKRAREEILSPYRIIVSNGDDTHWIIKENEDYYLKLWNEGLEYLIRALNSGGSQVVDIGIWDKLVISKSFMFEFRAGIKANLVKWLMNIPVTSQADHSESIYKVLILPDEDINKNNTIYILTDKKLHKFILPFNKENMSKSEYDRIINTFEANENLVKYNIIKEIDPNNQLPFKIQRDVLCVVRGRKYRKYSSIIYAFGGKVPNIEEIAEIILGNEKESYDRYIIDKNNTLVFKNLNNTYRLYSNGLLEYKYIPGSSEQDRGDIGSAFEKAYIFISRIMNYLLDSDANLYLADIKDNNPNYYEFIFEYMIEGYPICINYDNYGSYGNRDNIDIKNAISIKVDNRRIIECNWLLMRIDRNRSSKEYNIYFQDMLDGIFKKYDKQKLEDFNIKNIMLAYLIDLSAGGGKINPVWMIEKYDNSYYYVPMMQKEDD